MSEDSPAYTLTETGKVLTETVQGVTMPADYSFATVNDYVHSFDRTYEDLEALCLGMACHIDKLNLAKSVAEHEREGFMEQAIAMSSALKVIRTWASVDGCLCADHVIDLCDRTLGIKK